ncbi:hypothetical protein [Yinghuangia sp. YIM S10712]|uniref:hypothetical protein n=1 Tax=Yinghuangia sp. YIM S10712 TaxID=3436930 RepID=UPI003F530834
MYTAVGALILGNPNWQRHIQGTDYPTAVCHANAVVSDYALREQDEKTGLLPSGVRLTLDDRWLGGGVWRASAKAEQPVPSEDFVLEPLGLGWAESLASQHPDPPAAATVRDAEPSAEQAPVPSPAPGGSTSPPANPAWTEPVSTPDSSPAHRGTSVPPWWPDDSELDTAVEVDADGPVLAWAQPLRRADVVAGYAPVPAHVARRLCGVDGRSDCVDSLSVRLELDHPGSALSANAASHTVNVVSHGEGVRLDGVSWPSVFTPGLWLWFEWPYGSRTIRAHTRLLDRPVTVDGELLEHRYDPRVLTRDGLSVRCAAPRDRHDTYRIVPAAIRRLGLLDRDGRALLGRSDVPAAVRAVLSDLRVDVHIGNDRVEGTLAGLLAQGRLTVMWGSRGPDGRTHHPARAHQQPAELVCYKPQLAYPTTPFAHDPSTTSVPTSTGLVSQHQVAGFLRRIGHLGREASDEQRELYREDRLRYRLTGPAELPAGYTYVRPHSRGH